MLFQLQDVDALPDTEYNDDGKQYTMYYYNAAYNIKLVKVKDGANVKRAFLRALHNIGVECFKGKCRVDVQDGGDYLELIERKTGRPLFAFVYYSKEV